MTQFYVSSPCVEQFCKGTVYAVTKDNFYFFKLICTLSLIEATGMASTICYRKDLIIFKGNLTVI